MPSNKGDTLEFPWGRFLLWGLIAVVGLIVIIFLLAWWADARDPDAEAETDVGPQVEWSIVLVDQTGDTVTLKGDLPRGLPTETWANDALILRDPSGTFDWDMDQELPVAVVEIDASDGCDELNADLDTWVAEIGSVTTGEPQHWQARAFAQFALDKMKDEGCEIDEATLTEVSEDA